MKNFYALAAGPHPRRELTLTPSLGFPCPHSGVAAGADFFSLAAGPQPPLVAVGPSYGGRAVAFDEGGHPRRELTLMPRINSPRLGMAAGADSYYWRWRPTSLLRGQGCSSRGNIRQCL